MQKQQNSNLKNLKTSNYLGGFIKKSSLKSFAALFLTV